MQPNFIDFEKNIFIILLLQDRDFFNISYGLTLFRS